MEKVFQFVSPSHLLYELPIDGGVPFLLNFQITPTVQFVGIGGYIASHSQNILDIVSTPSLTNYLQNVPWVNHGAAETRNAFGSE